MTCCEWQYLARSTPINIIGSVTSDSPSRGVLVDTRQHAEAALSALATALSRLSGERSHAGALQSGLERTAANLAVYRENLTASASRIEDADLAAEIATLAKQQILTQTATPCSPMPVQVTPLAADRIRHGSPHRKCYHA